jgi:hypothetical protein
MLRAPCDRFARAHESMWQKSCQNPEPPIIRTIIGRQNYTLQVAIHSLHVAWVVLHPTYLGRPWK